MPCILNIETSGTMCSVALSEGDELLSIAEINSGYTHAENVHLFIKKVLVSAGKKITDVNAVSISSGPGSYTGLRIGFSAAKGLAYALNIPLIVMDTLQILTSIAMRSIGDKEILFCPLLDARRMEVYTALYSGNYNVLLKPCALVLDEKSIPIFHQNLPVCFFGDGLPKAKMLLNTFADALFVEDVTLTATAMISMAYKKFTQNNFADVAYAEPFYLKDFYFAAKK